MVFIIERSMDGLTGWTARHVAGSNATSRDDTSLSNKTQYFYRVAASNDGGDTSYSNTAGATTDTLLALTMLSIVASGDSFTMGDCTWGPGVSQTLSSNYRLGTYEVTNAQFAQFISDGGYTTSAYWTTNGWAQKESQGWVQPAYWTDANFNGSDQPVVGVSWYEAVAFCNWRTVQESLVKAYDNTGLATLSATGYRLPTEGEWEYAAAKGASGQAEGLFAWGDTWDSAKAVSGVTHPAAVGSMSPDGDTPQGLCDMTGNNRE
jgi:formylglycine-generating enzyme required for sulfatase activity